MVQHRWRPGNNRRDPRQLVHDHRGGGGAKWRAGRTISTERATPKFSDRHPHQAAAACGTPAFPERPDRKPDRAATPADEDHPTGDAEPSYLHADIYPDPSAPPDGTDPRAELAGTAHERVRAGPSGGHIVGMGPAHSTVHRDSSLRWLASPELIAVE
jgi:hypothetical protein